MAFREAHHFSIQNFTAVDRSNGDNVFKHLEQEACMGAGHRSKERFDAPKCHPETRKAVIGDIISWASSKGSKESIMWMSGPAGAGKSAIAQTVCEKCYNEKTLLAAFFFSRTATGAGRDDGNRLVPTIACQLAIAVPEAKSLIIDALEADTAVLSYSMEVQMQKLVLEPLSQVYAMIDQTKSNRAVDITTENQSNEVDIKQCTARVPHLVVIDGLDECKDPQMQSNIIIMIANILSKTEIRLRFLIASRPELEIRNTFQISLVYNICAQIVLNQDYEADDDIRVYLQSEFASLKREHTLASSLMGDSNWPSPHDIQGLVTHSSGQFVYASTIMKYLKHPRRDPRDVLQSIFEFNSKRENDNSLFKESPFAHLDALYRQVLNAAVSNLQNRKDSITIIFQVLLFERETWSDYNLRSTSTMASFISMKKTKLELLLSDLHSIMFIHDDNLQFYHASFGDFLKDNSRSGDFYIDEKEAHTVLAHHCFTRLCEYQPHSTLTDVEEYSRHHYFSHIEESGYNDTLLKELHDSDTPNLRTILSLIMQRETRGTVDVAESPFKEQMSVFFYFSFDDDHFTMPKEENLKEICDRMTEIIDELVLSSYPSAEDAKESILNAIVDIVETRDYGFTRQSSLHRCWLAMMLEIPERGKHLYLDSNKCLSLYTELCSKSKLEEAGVEESWHITVMRYLLNRIEPSADIDTDAFKVMSKKIFNSDEGDSEGEYEEENVENNEEESNGDVDEDNDGDGDDGSDTSGDEDNNGEVDKDDDAGEENERNDANDDEYEDGNSGEEEESEWDTVEESNEEDNEDHNAEGDQERDVEVGEKSETGTEGSEDRDAAAEGNEGSDGNSDKSSGDNEDSQLEDSDQGTDVNDFMQSVNEFIQKCVSLKNARLEKAVLEHPVNDSEKEAEVVEEQLNSLEQSAVQEYSADVDLQSTVTNDDPINSVEQEAPGTQHSKDLDQAAGKKIPVVDDFEKARVVEEHPKSLEQPTIQEHPANTERKASAANDDPINGEQKAPGERDQTALPEPPVKQKRSNRILLAFKELPRNILKIVCLH